MHDSMCCHGFTRLQGAGGGDQSGHIQTSSSSTVHRAYVSIHCKTWKLLPQTIIGSMQPLQMKLLDIAAGRARHGICLRSGHGVICQGLEFDSF